MKGLVCQLILLHGLKIDITGICNFQDKHVSFELVFSWQGQWQAVAERTLDFQQSREEVFLEEISWHVLAQMKLRNFAAASEALSVLRGLDSQKDMTDGVRRML